MNAFDVLDALLILEQSGKGIREFFEANDVKDVAVYGLGRVGARVIDAIKRSGVHVIYGIDKDADNICCDGMKVIHPDEVQSEDHCDLIIITPMEHYYDIKEELEERINTDIISIAEIVEYCLDGEEGICVNVTRKEKHVDVSHREIDRKERSRNVLIFGGSSGIGKAIAKRMVEAGAKVVIASRSAEHLHQAKTEIDSERCFTMRADVSNIERHRIFFETAYQKMGGLDAFVNAAAISLEAAGRGYEPWDITEQEWDEVADTDFKAAYFLMRNEVDYLKQNHIAGNILNFSSNAACMDITGLYGASKLAIMRWTRAFGKKFGHEGIIINAIAPGAVFTPMISSYAKDKDQVYLRHAIERFIRPDEIAKLARYMMSNEGIMLCGTTVVADGGDAATV